MERDEDLRVELVGGAVLQIRVTNDGDGIEIRNNGLSIHRQISVVPNCSNVIEVYPR